MTSILINGTKLVGEMMEWQPIETAPRDGRDVLLYWPLHGLAKEFSRTKIGYWREEQRWVWQDRAVRSYSEEPRAPAGFASFERSALTERQGTKSMSCEHGTKYIAYNCPCWVCAQQRTVSPVEASVSNLKEGTRLPLTVRAIEVVGKAYEWAAKMRSRETR